MIGSEIEFPGNGNETEGDGECTWDEHEHSGMIDQGAGIGEIMAVEPLCDGADSKAEERTNC